MPEPGDANPNSHPDVAARVSGWLDLQTDGWIGALVGTYADPRGARVLEGVLSQALRLGARSAIRERNYIDRDYRSEYSAFYSAAFRQTPSVATRLHFFSEPIPSQVADGVEPATLDSLDLTYLGYVVIRPIRAAPVGRSMLAVPETHQRALTCIARETINLFGRDFEVSGFPFIAQDAHFGVCAHADVWMVGYYSYLRHRDAPRVTPAQLAVGSHQQRARPIVEAGVHLPEMREMLYSVGFLPTTYNFKSDRGRHRPHEIAVRYLDSGIPIILAHGGHVVTAIGYRRTTGLVPRIELLVHDDERGPYLQIGDAGIRYGAWEAMVVPLPPKVWIRADAAEMRAKQAASLQLATTGAGRHLNSAIAARQFHWRTVCVESNEFKSTLQTRGASAAVAVHYQRMSMPRWIWLVELIDSAAADHEAVVGEVLWDATNHHRGGDVLAWRLADQFRIHEPWEDGRTVPVNVDPASRMLPMRPKGRTW
ncbi:hypothetical protein [uncultured Nocardioides sp.]|uniref:hypothetical protein n=1 Tax=uncultured Nocardioides sp. TaxID=198441 RepID=UPI00260E5380|nr:hypothetical protein [uncultured Nocardioides sp.]